MMGKKSKRRYAAHKGALGLGTPQSPQEFERYSCPTFDPTEHGIKENSFTIQETEGSFVFRFFVPDLIRIKEIKRINRDLVLEGIGLSKGKYYLPKDQAQAGSFEVGREVPARMIEAIFDKQTGKSEAREVPVLFTNCEAINFVDGEKIFDDINDQYHPLIITAQNFYKFIKADHPQVADFCASVAEKGREYCPRIKKIIAMTSIIANWQGGEILAKCEMPAVYSANAGLWGSDLSSHVIAANGKYFSTKPAANKDFGFSAFCEISAPLRNARAGVNNCQLARREETPYFNMYTCADFVAYSNSVAKRSVLFDKTYDLYLCRDSTTLERLPVGQLCELFDMLCYEPRSNNALVHAIKNRVATWSLSDLDESIYPDAAKFLMHLMLYRHNNRVSGKISEIMGYVDSAIVDNPILGAYCLEHAHEFGLYWRFKEFRWQDDEKLIPVFEIDGAEFSIKGGQRLETLNASREAKIGGIVRDLWRNYLSGNQSFFALPDEQAGYVFKVYDRDIVDFSVAERIMEAIPDIEGWIIRIYERVHTSDNGINYFTIEAMALGAENYWHMTVGVNYQFKDSVSELVQLLKSEEFAAKFADEIIVRRDWPERKDALGRADHLLEVHGLERTKMVGLLQRDVANPEITFVAANHRNKVCVFDRFYFKDGQVFDCKVTSKINDYENAQTAIAKRVISHFSKPDAAAEDKGGGPYKLVM